jgi:chondroitin AC lyase
VLDWQKIPGTTVVQKEKLTGSPRRRGETEFVGGVSDGRYGAAAFRFHNSDEKLRARKAWFFFDEAFVCLGAGISHPSDRRVVTTLNQCLLDGEVVCAADGGRTKLDRGAHTLEDASWVLHDRIGYVFPGSADAHLANREKTGSWWRANHQYSKDEVKEDVFTLWLDHGQSPDGAGYSYIVVPNTGTDELADFADDPPLRIVRNEPGLQAVWHGEKRILQAAFYEPGRVELDDGLAVEAEKPSIVMVRYSDGEAKIAVSDPTQELDALDLAVTVPAPDGTAKKRELHIDLPDGPQAGSTAVRTLR